MSNLPTRRGFLALAGTTTAASLAGCSQLDSLSQSDGGSNDAVTLAVTPAQAELAELESEVRSEIENGTLSERAAAQEFRDGRAELTAEATTAVEESAGSDLTIEESAPEYGLLRATGTDAAIMETLRSGDVSGIYPGEQYDLIIQQRQQEEQRRAMLEEQQQAQDAENATDDSGTENATDDSGTENATDG
ncbi:hypothetical protein [Natrinema longum]|uniref:Uncharacterized protein n=1 Tax=Natrinema longum TaxID=370324 RepID=A0A8A2UAQ3_9EURY|nr:hypothetical protein [Natrinema longum]MBZ6496252.1 hypothetical protein [Natrinema longum]QSW85829.1 hypothetical protein J0X27_03050 [Natrinema longum]